MVIRGRPQNLWPHIWEQRTGMRWVGMGDRETTHCAIRDGPQGAKKRIQCAAPKSASGALRYNYENQTDDLPPHKMVVGGLGTRKLGFHVLHEEQLIQARVAVRKHGPPRVPGVGVQAVQPCAAAGVIEVTAGLTPSASGAFGERDAPGRASELEADATVCLRPERGRKI